MNVPHAKELYQELIRLYPSSPQAQTARERLAKLNAG
jgi:TolA-binding protein